MRAMRRLLACMLLFALAWGGGLWWFVQDIPRQASTETEKTDALVVLTGGRGRIEYGVSQYRLGLAERLFISGVEKGNALKGLLAGTEAELGFGARNTIGNAMEVGGWMRANNLHSLRLVTTHYHMPRALLEFRYALPDMTIVPSPFTPTSPNIDAWWRFGSPDSKIVVSEYHKYLLALARHTLIDAVETNS